MEALGGAGPRPPTSCGLYAALSRAKTSEKVLAEFRRARRSPAFKPALAELAVESLAPIAAAMRELSGDHAHIDAVLADGAERAAAIAGPILREAYEVVGLLRTRS